MEKTCLNCKFEPDWKLYNEKHGFNFEIEAGKCKYPLPHTLTPFVGKNPVDTLVKDNDGNYFVDMASGSICYAWEAKE